MPIVLRMLLAAALMVVLATVLLREWETQGPSKQSDPVLAKMSAAQNNIRDNDTAEDIVTIGMTAAEVKDRIAKPEPPWTMFMLKEWSEGDALRITISEPTANPLVLTTVGGDVLESPYYAWVFFSPDYLIWEPTFVYFQAKDDIVIHVAPFDCDDTLVALALCSWEVASEY